MESKTSWDFDALWIDALDAALNRKVDIQTWNLAWTTLIAQREIVKPRDNIQQNIKTELLDLAPPEKEPESKSSR